MNHYRQENNSIKTLNCRKIKEGMNKYNEVTAIIRGLNPQGIKDINEQYRTESYKIPNPYFLDFITKIREIANKIPYTPHICKDIEISSDSDFSTDIMDKVNACAYLLFKKEVNV